MLEGVGGRTTQAKVAGMASVRIACLTCHRTRDVSATGTVVWKASAETCLMCHDRQMTDQRLTYHKSLRDSLDSLDATLTRIREAIPDAELSAERSKTLDTQLEDIQHDVTFLRVGNGIHNVHYADTLTRSVVDSMTKVCRELKIEVPEIDLPEPAKPAAGEAAKPAAEQPAKTDPEPAQPEATEPEATEPEAKEPEAKEPEPAKVEPMEAGAARPEPAESEPGKPDAEKPEAAQPEPAESAPAEPETAKPEPNAPPPAEPKVKPSPEGSDS